MRDTVVAATVAIMRESDIAAVSMPDVAAAAGISVRTLYRHFPSRDALVIAALAAVLDDLRTEVEVSSVHDLPAAFEELADLLETHPELLRLLAEPGSEQALTDVIGRDHCALIRSLLDDVATDSDGLPGLAVASAPVIAFLTSPQGLVRIATSCGCAYGEARDAVAAVLAELVGGKPARERASQRPESVARRPTGDTAKSAPAPRAETRRWHPVTLPREDSDPSS